MKSFLSFGDIVNKYALISGPLTNLTRKRVGFILGSRMLEDSNDTRAWTAHILVYADYTKQFTSTTETSLAKNTNCLFKKIEQRNYLALHLGLVIKCALQNSYSIS